ncbi:hypothetical protein AMAG_15787 [Allomyces macrogynus ATCC 38327]|uniref:Uncharacterized protein n=1 Tax=Allomyces macrogynus (strain ATCC 38327) TaxID=578462 RepID=A0A0L0T8S0_ALLM3|nr:hypothetical protein AMAG_15787 [Allomyces macrogynus ATCC 38327]|eukprot:KNE71115.1 hypothetical protein AMAG_15787 [Allomyces macrogynus ATCC 38327]
MARFAAWAFPKLVTPPEQVVIVGDAHAAFGALMVVLDTVLRPAKIERQGLGREIEIAQRRTSGTCARFRRPRVWCGKMVGEGLRVVVGLRLNAEGDGIVGKGGQGRAGVGDARCQLARRTARSSSIRRPGTPR